MISRRHEDERIIVEYDEEDADMDLIQVASHHEHLHRYGEEGGEDEEEERSDGDEYGGMLHDLYNNIVEFKKNGTYPSTLNSRQDRSALSHWRARCARYEMAEDGETLLYFNSASAVNDAARVVVKKGEVRRVLERVHELIGHLGQKRTQMAVLKKLFWRSVRQDVKTYILSCGFCNRKKLEGKKILKAPVDISSDHFGFNVEARSGSNVADGDRLHITLNGYNEHEVQAAAMTRMTSYTFKETATEIRGGRFGRTIKPEFLAPGSSTTFRRQPYIRRTRFAPYSSAYMLPYTPKGPKGDTEYIVYTPSRSDPNGYPKYDEYEVENEVETIVDEHSEQLHDEVMQTSHISNSIENRQSLPPQVKEENHVILYETQSPQKRVQNSRSSLLKGSRRSRFNGGLTGKFTATTSDGERIDISQNSLDLLTPLDSIQHRAELLGVAPIMMLPTSDSEVIALQKELLTRQLRIQELQEKVLQSQLESSVRIPIARYEEIDPQGENMLDDNQGGIEDLNVMDSGDDEEIMKQYAS